MKVFILAAGCGTRLYPLTLDKPKCMVELQGRSIIEWQIETLLAGGIKRCDICIIAGYQADFLRERLPYKGIKIFVNNRFPTTNMVYSLMCGKEILQKESDIIVSYGDIVYNIEILCKLLKSKNEISIVVDKEWFSYWSMRFEDPLLDAETLRMDSCQNIKEIGRKPESLEQIEAQYIGLMRFRGEGIQNLVNLCEIAKKHSSQQKKLWKMQCPYEEMYMTDLLQGLIDTGHILRAIEIKRNWFEVDCQKDLEIAEKFWDSRAFFNLNRGHEEI